MLKQPYTSGTSGFHRGYPHRLRGPPTSGYSAQVVGDEVRERLVHVDPQVLVARHDDVVGAVEEVCEFLGGRLEHGVPGRRPQLDHDALGVVGRGADADVTVAGV